MDGAEGGGPTVDPDRFQGRGEPYPGHWREFPRPWPVPDEAVLDDGIRQVLAAAIDALPDQERAVLRMRDVEGLPSEDVCSILHISAADQRMLLHRARAAVRGALGRHYGHA
jgi:RNA polymerase sigma-70 factor (ECF subfamily)